MDIQSLIVGLIITGAVAFVARSMYKSAKGKSCETGTCGCDAKPTIKAKHSS